MGVDAVLPGDGATMTPEMIEVRDTAIGFFIGSGIGAWLWAIILIPFFV